MKKLSVILNVVLLAAVAVIYVLYFTGGRKNSKATSGEANVPVEVTSSGVVYVNIDTVIFKFAMFTDKRNELTEMQKKSETELTTKGQAYERGVQDYQNKAQKGLITRADAATMEQGLMAQQQALVELRDKLSLDLQEKEQVMNRQVLEYITVYLDSVKSEYNYQYILGKSFGGQILYADDALDITARVVDGINKKYNEEKASTKK